MIRLETVSLVIRNFCAADWQDLQEMIVKYQASEYAQYDHKWPTAAKEIKGVAEWFAGGDDYLAVCLKTTGKLIGFIALKRDEEASGVEFNLGYVFHADYHGKGYATEGCRALLDHAYGALGADRVVSSTAVANGPSSRLLRRLGMVETGQQVGSLQKTPDGEPIEFVGVSYALSREQRAALGRASTRGEQSDAI